MTPLKPNSSGPNQPPHAEKGFALIVTLSLMILLTVIAVGLLTLGSVSLRSANSSSAQTTARANARMALMIAIGELQKQVGPDQRVTMTSALVNGPPPANPNWTGAIDVSNTVASTDPKSEPVSWLVSGQKPDPAVALAESTEWNKGNALKLGTSKSSGTGTAIKLHAPVQNISQGVTKGRYAWWIADEGTKARVDLARPKTNPSDREKIARSQTPLESGIMNLGSTWKEFSPDGKIDKSALISINTAALAAEQATIPGEYFNDLTTGGFGLPVSVTKGGMKADLTLIFDKSQSSKPYGQRYFGATPTTTSIDKNAATTLSFTPTTPSKFFLSETIAKNGSVPAGPNWGILWNYANLWMSPNQSGQESLLIGPNPPNRTDIRFKDWAPYTNSDRSNGVGFNYRTDKQHTNSPLCPVISTLQLGFRFSSERVATANDTDPVFFKAQITMQPVFGIWNPYNITIKAAPYVFDWAIYPRFTLGFGKSLGNGVYGDAKISNLWLREQWASGDFIPTSDKPTATSYFSAKTDPVDLQPGEFRLFSALDRTKVAPGSGSGYMLKSGWSEKGGFTVDLKDSKTGGDCLIPSGYSAWFGNIVLLDTQDPGITTKFPSLDPSKVASTFVCLKARNPNESILYRATDLWNGDSKAKPLIPEPIISGSNGGPQTSKPSYVIDKIEGDTVMAHIATWSFFSRTTQQVEDGDQRLRGWIDTNPRAIASNPAWDGSRVTASGGHEGWKTSSQFLGVYNPPGKPKQIGDGYGGNRGLLGEGGSTSFEPNVNLGGRYQGFGGAANTNAGQNRVVVYDVPRSPLVSIGQFQHAQLARYNFEPGFVLGNSYANVRIPLDAIVSNNFAGVTGLNIVDTSYEVNRKLWDDYYFSTLGIDFKSTTETKFDKVYDFKKLLSGEGSLPNPRMLFNPLPGDTSIDKIIADAGDRAPEAIAARTMVKGAFNVNSTSKTAWKAVLSSMGASQLPVIDPTNPSSLSWEDPGGIRFNRFGSVINKEPYVAGGAGDDPNFWQSWRKLSADELDKLSEAIVEEVKERGPFRSLAEFVNRNPNSTKEAHRRKGALQAAIDRTINNSLPASVGVAATKPNGTQFSAAVDGENQAAGSASYLLQGDVLQSLGPVLQARSDYFKIRTCGEAVDPSGKVIARAWCEAYVQRSNKYIDTIDQAHFASSELTSTPNKKFGRRLEVVSFRWLSSTEI